MAHGSDELLTTFVLHEKDRAYSGKLFQWVCVAWWEAAARCMGPVVGCLGSLGQLVSADELTGYVTCLTRRVWLFQRSWANSHHRCYRGLSVPLELVGPVSVVFIAGNYKLIFEMNELRQKE